MSADDDLEEFRRELEALELNFDEFKGDEDAKDRLIDDQEDVIGELKVKVANLKDELEQAKANDALKRKDAIIKELVQAMTREMDFREFKPKNEIIKKLLKKTKGTLKMEKGTYEGDIIGGIANGKGKVVFDNHQTYEGEWLNNKITGKGTYTWPGGRRYEGEMKDGVLDGRGIYYYPSGDTYEGEYRHGKKEGFGIYKYKNGDCSYGFYKDGEYNGLMIMVPDDKNLLSVKHFQMGKPHGHCATYENTGTKDYFDGVEIKK